MGPSSTMPGRSILLCAAALAVVAMGVSAEVTPLWEQQQELFDSVIPDVELEQVEATSPDAPGDLADSEKPFPFDPVGDKFAGKIIHATGDPMADPTNTLDFPKHHYPANPCLQHVGHNFEWTTTKHGDTISGTGKWTKIGLLGAGLKAKATLKDSLGKFYASYEMDIMAAQGSACFAVVKPIKWNLAATGAKPTVSCVTFYPDVRTQVSTGCGSVDEKCLTTCDDSTGASGGGRIVWHNTGKVGKA